MKNVIFLFMEGGPSHLDTFDYKPLLNKLAGQSLPASFGTPLTAAGEGVTPSARMQTHLETTRPGAWRVSTGSPMSHVMPMISP